MDVRDGKRSEALERRVTELSRAAVRVGYLFVLDKEGGGEFTAGDSRWKGIGAAASGRAEEIELSVSDGRSVRTLINSADSRAGRRGRIGRSRPLWPCSGPTRTPRET